MMETDELHLRQVGDADGVYMYGDCGKGCMTRRGEAIASHGHGAHVCAPVGARGGFDARLGGNASCGVRLCML